MACICMGPQNGEPLCPCMMRKAGLYRDEQVFTYVNDAEKDREAARRALEDFERRGGTTLEELKRELGLQ